MLKKHERLTKSTFDTHFQNGKRLHSGLFTLIHDKTPQFHGAVVVPKKILKSAVERNKLRRRIYDVLQRTVAGAQGGVYIIIAKQQAVNASYQTLKEELTKLIGRT